MPLISINKDVGVSKRLTCNNDKLRTITDWNREILLKEG